MAYNSSAAVPERRSLVRQRVTISAGMIEPGSNEHSFCQVLDATREGCRIFCQSAPKLPDCVFLHPEGVSKPIKAKVLWRKEMTAGLSLEWADTVLV